MTVAQQSMVLSVVDAMGHNLAVTSGTGELKWMAQAPPDATMFVATPSSSDGGYVITNAHFPSLAMATTRDGYAEFRQQDAPQTFRYSGTSLVNAQTGQAVKFGSVDVRVVQLGQRAAGTCGDDGGPSSMLTTVIIIITCLGLAIVIALVVVLMRSKTATVAGGQVPSSAPPPAIMIPAQQQQLLDLFGP